MQRLQIPNRDFGGSPSTSRRKASGGSNLKTPESIKSRSERKYSTVREFISFFPVNIFNFQLTCFITRIN